LTENRNVTLSQSLIFKVKKHLKRLVTKLLLSFRKSASKFWPETRK